MTCIVMGPTHSQIAAWRRLVELGVLMILTVSVFAAENGFSLVDAQGNEINVEVMPGQGEVLAVWFVDHEEVRPQFESMLRAINASGVEVWRVDLLSDYFLQRSSETERTLSGDGVAAVIDSAHARSSKTILLAAYDRMPLPLLRGVRQWQSVFHGESRLAGALLFYPNLFGPPPVAGREPVLDPIVHATNIAVTVYQPMAGSQRWRLDRVMNALWAGGSPAFAYLVPDVRDWFFMHPPDKDPAEKAATANVPQNLLALTALMNAAPKPSGPAPLTAEQTPAKRVQGLVALQAREPAQPFSLDDLFGKQVRLEDYRGRVTLVNFWATWCPPCVEEIPSLNQLAQRYSDESLSVISIDYRESEETIRRFTGRIPVEFPILLDRDGRMSLQWKVFSFPSSFILDRQGRVRYSVNRAIDWNTSEVWTALDTLLAEPLSGEE